ncbi:hypothetical protein T492DRAFT_895605 [Pavlovales sp. CCMP2436]|nr:hypothetical protein T492DRAFT_895605 [Pavlovales sp. CCMP2436]
MDAIAFIAAAGPLRDAVEVREIAARPVESVAAQLPDTSSTSSAAVQAKAVASLFAPTVGPPPPASLAFE